MPSPNNSLTMLPPVLKVDQLSFGYDQSLVLDRVSFVVNEGEFIGIIGPNGGGKSTLLKLILGFLKPTCGSISLFSESLGSIKRQQIAYVPQSVRFDRDFPISVIEVVLSGLLSKLPWYGKFGVKEENAAREALDQVGLLAFRHHPFGKLSGGQAQRVLIARALVAKPRLLLLDEPTASVDTQAEGEIYSILNRLKGTMTILMVTHDLRIAVEQADRLLCVQREVFSLNPSEVCEHYAMGLFHDPLLTSGRIVDRNTKSP